MNVHCSSPEGIFVSTDPRADRWKGTTRQVNMTISLAFLTPDLVEACRDIAAGSTR